MCINGIRGRVESLTPTPLNRALPLLKAAYDLGITSWDTANIYSNGESEKIIGKAVKKYNLPRHKLIIMTKCFNPIGETLEIKADTIRDDTNKDYVNQHGLSRAAIFNAVEASLERLDMKYIDLLQVCIEARAATD